MLYRIESTFGGFGDVSVEIFALPKACHSGSVGVKYLITDIQLAKMLENDINVLGHTYCNAGCSKTIIINRVGRGRG